MKNKTLAYALLGLALPLYSISKAPFVSVDIAPLHSLVSQVMEGVDQPSLLIPAEASPHEYELRPSQAQALSDADVVFWMGEEFTPWLEKALDNVADSSEKIAMLDLEETITYKFREGADFEEHKHHDEHEEGEHEEGEHEEGEHEDEKHEAEERHEDGEEEHHEDEHHAHEGVDPHAWLDPKNAIIWVKEIERVLSKLDTENASIYKKNAKKSISKLKKLIKKTNKEIKKLGQPKFIVFHDAYLYYEKRFNLSASGSISVGDAEDPSPARISEIQDIVNKGEINCVFTEPQYNSGIVKNIFAGTSVVNIGVMDPLGASIEPGSQHYSKLIQALTKSLSQCKQ